MNIYQKTYLQEIKIQNKINYLKYLINQSKSLSKNIQNKIKKLILEQFNIICENSAVQPLTLNNILDYMLSADKITQQELSTELSPELFNKIQNLIINAVHQSQEKEVREQFNINITADKNNLTYIQSILTKITNSKTIEQLSRIKPKYASDYIKLKYPNQNDIPNNIKDEKLDKNIILTLCEKLKNDEYQLIKQIQNKNNLFFNLLSDLSKDILTQFLNYKSQLNTPKYKNFYNQSSNDPIEIEINNNEVTISNNNGLLLPEFEKIKQFIDYIYPITINTSAAGGQGEYILSLLLPGASKTTDEGDITIFTEKAEVKSLSLYKTAKLSGQKKGTISRTDNVNFINNFINYILVNTLNKQEMKYVKASDNLNQFNINTRHMKQNQGFLKILNNQFKNININTKEIKDIISAAFNNAFSKKYHDAVSIELINDASNQLANTFEFTNNEFKFTDYAISIWEKCFGIIELIAYFNREQSKYFICCSNNSNFKCTIFSTENIKRII